MAKLLPRSVMLEPSVIIELEEVAKSRGDSFSQLVRKIVTDWLKER